MIHIPDIAIFPSCAFAQGFDGKKREEEMRINLDIFHHTFSSTHILVVDNGLSKPNIQSYAKLIYCPELTTNHPSIGEVTLLKRGLSDVSDNARVLKMHARCSIANIKDLKQLLRNSGDFLLLNRNIFSWFNSGLDGFPYIDTRIFCLRNDILNVFLTSSLANIMKTNSRFEHAALASIYENPQISVFVKSRGCFYPIMRGEAGHHRNYSTYTSTVRSSLKSLLFRIGL